MSFGIKRTEGGFQKLVWENCSDTLAGGVNIDMSTLDAADYPDGVIPEGTPIKKDFATGLVTITEADPAGVIGYTNQTIKFEAGQNVLVGVGISGVVRVKTLPAIVQANLAAYKTSLPKITHV